MLELAVLGLLKERPMHGYELKKQLGQRLGFFWTVSFGSLYPTLKKLEKRGVVAKVKTGSEQRRRKEYRITAPGEEEFLRLLEEGAGTTWEEEKFPLRLAFFRYVAPEIRIRLLERRKAQLEEKLEEGHRSLACQSITDTYVRALVRHGMAITSADIAWLDELILAERAALASDLSDAVEASEASRRTAAESEGPAPTASVAEL